MRAIGFAALSFGAVIALSATLGMSYRSDASPMDDPTSSVTDSTSPVVTDSSSAADDSTTPAASDTTTPAADDSSSPAASDDATTPAASDSSSPAADDSASPTGDPSPTDSDSPSDPPTQNAGAFRPFFVSDFASPGPSPDVTWAFTDVRSIHSTVALTGGANEVNITYQQFDLAGSPIGDPGAGFSGTVTDSAAHDYGNTYMPGPGLWQVTVTQSWSDDNFGPASTSTFFYVPDVPSIRSLNNSEGIEFNGRGTPGDQIEVVTGNPNALGSSYTVVCGGTESEPVDDDGNWTCASGENERSTATYWAIQIDSGNCNTGVDSEGCRFADPNQAGALSPASAPITNFASVDFEPRPAGAHLVANPGAGSNGTNVYYARWQTFTEDDEQFTDWDFDGQLWCTGGEGGFISGTNTCDNSDLTPGYYLYEVDQSATDGEVINYFTVPSTPSLSVTPSGSGRAVLSGSVADDEVSTVGDPVHVLVDGNSPKCDGSTVAADGAWSCVITGLSAGPHNFQAFVEDANTGDPDIEFPDHVTGGLSAGSTIAPATITVTAAATPSATPTPSASPTTLPDWFFTVTGVDLNNVHPGDTFTVSGSGLPPGSTVSGELHSKAVSIGSAVVQPDGTFTLPVTVPADFPAGAHTIVMTLTPPGSSAVASQQPLKVVPASVPSTDDTPTPSDSPSPLGSAEGPGIDHHGPNSNILTHGLNSIADVLAHPAKIPAALEIGLVLLIFAVLPGHLLNATLAEQYERFTKRRSQRRRAPGRWARLVAFLHRAPFVAGLALTTATALLFGFADPRFGFSLASLRLFLGLAIALAIVSYLTNALVSRIMRGRWKVDVEVSLRPLGLILTVVGVVVSRLLDFSPGFLIGLVLGLVISEKHLAKQAWRAVLLRSSILLGLALLAWFAFSLFDAKEEGGTFASELAVETLVAITTEAVVGLLVELLPLKLLEGEKLYEKSKVLWGALYLLAVFIFVVAVVPWEGNWAQLGSSLWTWIGIVVGFGIVATGVYLYFRIRGHEEHEEHVITDEDGDKLVPIGSEDDER